MGLTDYVVAIPSYKRPDTLKNKTLKVLQRYKIDPKKIVVFVADKEQEKIYREALPKGSVGKFVVGVPGIKNIRNFMPKYFPEGQYIFYMDDDHYDTKLFFPIYDTTYFCLRVLTVQLLWVRLFGKQLKIQHAKISGCIREETCNWKLRQNNLKH